MNLRSHLACTFLACLPFAQGVAGDEGCFKGAAQSGFDSAIDGQALLQRRSQRNRAGKDGAATLPNETPFEGCPLPEDGIWCEVRLQNLPIFWMAARKGGDPVSMWVCEKGFWEEDDMSQFGAPGHLLDV